MTTTIASSHTEQQKQAFMERLLKSVSAPLICSRFILAIALALYRALAESFGLTSVERPIWALPNFHH